MNEPTDGKWKHIGETSMNTEEKRESDITRKKTVGIYGLRNKINGKWYVGQSVDVEQRWIKYKNCDCKKQRRLYNAILKYGYDNFEKTIIEECDENPWIMDYREMYWIRNMQTIENGYNCTEGGSGGRKSKETREKMSAWQIGKKHSEETKRKIGLKSIGRKFTDEMNKRKGRPFTEERKRAVSLRFRGKRRSPEVIAKIIETKKRKRMEIRQEF